MQSQAMFLEINLGGSSLSIEQIQGLSALSIITYIS